MQIACMMINSISIIFGDLVFIYIWPVVSWKPLLPWSSVLSGSRWGPLFSACSKTPSSQAALWLLHCIWGTRILGKIEWSCVQRSVVSLQDLAISRLLGMLRPQLSPRIYFLPFFLKAHHIPLPPLEPPCIISSMVETLGKQEPEEGKHWAGHPPGWSHTILRVGFRSDFTHEALSVCSRGPCLSCRREVL